MSTLLYPSSLRNVCLQTCRKNVIYQQFCLYFKINTVLRMNNSRILTIKNVKFLYESEYIGRLSNLH